MKVIKEIKREIENDFKLKKMNKIVVQDKKQSKRIKRVVSKINFD